MRDNNGELEYVEGVCTVWTPDTYFVHFHQSGNCYQVERKVYETWKHGIDNNLPPYAGVSVFTKRCPK